MVGVCEQPSLGLAFVLKDTVKRPLPFSAQPSMVSFNLIDLLRPPLPIQLEGIDANTIRTLFQREFR